MLEDTTPQKGRKRWLTVIVAVAAVLLDILGAAIVDQAPRIVQVARVAAGDPPGGQVPVEAGPATCGS